MSGNLPIVELLSPAGDETCAIAAIENGADAVYFGLDSGFNARARAKNFSLGGLDDFIRTLHRRGVRGYVTMNTLVFASELENLAKTIRRIASSGVDAILVQDLGVAALVREMCPQLHVHASTQMSMTSAETIAVAERLGLKRVVVARELSVAEIRKITSATTMPIEVFIHGALCVAYSGQCLTSESLGGRSANRGQCAQACRLPYDVVCDGEQRDLGDMKYLLSPQDLAGYAAIPDLIQAGVCSLKIEGRLKTPEYVANITSHYRRAIDEAVRGVASTITPDNVREMEMSFSRGFSPGWLEGNDHKQLVPATESAKRGAFVGMVVEKRGESVIVELSAEVKRGDGIAFDGDRLSGAQQGGRVYEIRRNGRDVPGDAIGDEIELRFVHGGIDTDAIPDHARVWKTDDPQLNKRLRASFEVADPAYRRPLDVRVIAKVGSPLTIEATFSLSGAAVGYGTVTADTPLETARNRPATQESITEQLDRMGGTPFRVGVLRIELEGSPMVPSSLLNQLRRDLVEQLITSLETAPTRRIDDEALPTMLAQKVTEIDSSATPLRVLCRTLDQVRGAAEFGVSRIYVDFHDIRLYRHAIEIAHQYGGEIFIASVRIQKPGESGLMKVLMRHQPDGYLVRNLAALDYFHRNGGRVVGDFSLNVVNPLSAKWLIDQGCEQVTTSYDLNRDQLQELVSSTTASRLEVVVHQHMPMFHMEHCVFCSVLSPGTNKTNCGRPCDRHVVQLRDRVGSAHPLQADVACRNTLYNAVPQSGAEAVPMLLSAGVGAVRIELLEENAAATKSVLSLYQSLLAGEVTGREVWTRLKALNRVGVTRGTLEAARDPLAIL